MNNEVSASLKKYPVYEDESRLMPFTLLILTFHLPTTAEREIIVLLFHVEPTFLLSMAFLVSLVV